MLSHWCLIVTVFSVFALVIPASAQSDLSSLWPLEVGDQWNFDVRVEGEFTGIQTGNYQLTIVGQNPASSGGMAACFDLVSTVLPSANVQSAEFSMALPVYVTTSILLQPPPCGFDVGVVVDDGTALGTWSNTDGDWLWWWVPANLAPGSSFRLEVLRGRTSRAFLNGEIRTVEGFVSTSVGSFSDATIVDYLLEYPEQPVLLNGEVIGTVITELSGWIAFVPGVGPVASEETTTTTEVDCPDCPPALFEPWTNTLDLQATNPVSANKKSISSLKGRY